MTTPDARTSPWLLSIYIAGQSPKSLKALADLGTLCDKTLVGPFTIDIIDLLAAPQLAAKDNILTIPTLVRHLPLPRCQITGDLSDMNRVLTRLEPELTAAP